MNFFENLLKHAQKDYVKKNIVGAIIVNRKNELLLLKRKEDDFYGGIYEIPGGNVEDGEGIEEAIKREVKEETNLHVDKIKMFVNSFDYLSKSGKKSRQYNFEVLVSDFENIILTEHDNFKWSKIEDVLNDKLVTNEVKHSVEIFKYNKEI